MTDTYFKYMFLGRLKNDCDYFLGCSNQNPKVLWAGNVHDHINEMKTVWLTLNVKPNWLTLEQINEYEYEMTKISVDHTTQ